MSTLTEDCFVTDIITVDRLVPFLTRQRNIDYEIMTIEDFYDAVPPGWHCFKDEIFEAIQFFKVKLGKLEVNRGMLKLYATHENPIQDVLFKRYADNLRYHASKVCMMCGQYGWRRIDVNFKPILCNPHYLEFINIEEYYV